MAISEVAGAIGKYNNFVITSHVDTEGDAVGSELALFCLIKQLGKNAIMVNNDAVPERYRFLPGWDKIVVAENAKPETYDAAIVVDCPTVERTGNVAQWVRNSKVKINIDHHISNEDFGDFNWVDPEMSSCGEMIFDLYRELGLNINQEIATMLYVAILTDTGSFRYDATTSKTHHVAGELLKLGIRPDKIVEQVYETKRIGDIELLSKVLSTIALIKDGRITYMYVTKKMLEETCTLPDRTDGFINFPRSIDTCEISIFFREDMQNPKKIHVGFRSKGRANVNVLAGKFGGGGHPKASGCVIVGDLSEVIRKVLKTAEEFLL